MATSEVIKMPMVRLSFARLFKAKAFREGQTPRYEATFLLDPANPAHKKVIAQIKDEAKRIAKEHWGDKIPKSLSENLCFGSGDKKDYDGYEGMFFVSSNNQTRPTVVDTDKTPLTADDGKPYSGCYVDGSITLWTQDNEFGKRINANLRAVRFRKDGEAFGMKPVDVDDEFEDIADEADGLDDSTDDDDDDLGF